MEEANAKLPPIVGVLAVGYLARKKQAMTHYQIDREGLRPRVQPPTMAYAHTQQLEFAGRASHSR